MPEEPYNLVAELQRKGHVVCGCAQDITFFEEGEPLIDGEAGDLRFVVRTRPHKVFRRERHDLHANVTISLTDALTGFSTEVRGKPLLWCLTRQHHS